MPRLSECRIRRILESCDDNACKILVAAGIIHDDDFIMVVELWQNALNTLSAISGAVVDGNDNGDVGHERFLGCFHVQYSE